MDDEIINQAKNLFGSVTYDSLSKAIANYGYDKISPVLSMFDIDINEYINSLLTQAEKML